VTEFTAPIALFVYNRPEHTQRTLEALRENIGSDRSKLYVFADGPKNNIDAEGLQRIAEVRTLIRQDRWCREVEIIEADRNQGLAQSICAGVSSILDTHDRVIVLEDDLETSPGFLGYMNDALELYQVEPRVFQISGFMVRNRPWVPSTGFLRVTSSWGWGTWRRAWAHYRDDADNLLREVEQKGRFPFDLDGHSFHYQELERNVRGELRTWAVRWYASVFLKDGLCLYPRQSLVRNLGFDGTGVHCHDDKSQYHSGLRLASNIDVSKQTIVEDQRYLKAMQSHYRYLLQLWTGTRVRDRLRKKVNRAIRGKP
jgi:GT2 family glycosyltransferase